MLIQHPGEPGGLYVPQTPSAPGPISKVPKQRLLGTKVSHRSCSLPENTIIHLIGNLLPSGHSELDLRSARLPNEVSIWHQVGAATARHYWRRGCDEHDSANQMSIRAFRWMFLSLLNKRSNSSLRDECSLRYRCRAEQSVGGQPVFCSFLSRVSISS